MSSRRNFLAYLGGGAVGAVAWLEADNGRSEELRGIPGQEVGSPTPEPVPPTTPMPTLECAPHPKMTREIVYELEKRHFDAVNAFRERHDLPPVKYSENLAYISRVHSLEQYREGWVGHIDNVKQGKEYGRTPKDRLRYFGYEGGKMGFAENATLRVTTIDKSKTHTQDGEPIEDVILDNFLDSIPHREAIMNGEHEYVGVGIIAGKTDDTGFVEFRATQLFTHQGAGEEVTIS
jgi:uncharacterized protein YkwD